MKKNKKAFTLIEILIVVAIIAILASVVLVGLGPTQSLGRDSRRVADLHSVQNGLELYYNRNGGYPGIANNTTWATFAGYLTGANVGINSVPNDPSANKNYVYASDNAAGGGSGGTQYVVGACLENTAGGPWNNYNPPGNVGQTTHYTGLCGGANLTCTSSTAGQYCVSL